MSRTHSVSSLSAINDLKPQLTAQAKSIGARTFDPLDFVQTNVTSERARAQVLSSMAWYLDVTLINNVRAVFFDMFRDMQSAGDIDSYNTYLAAMSEREQREANLVEQGFMETEGIASIRRMLMLRVEWHDAVGAVNDRHVMPTIESLLQNEKVQTPNALTREKLRALADDEAEGNKQTADELYEELVRREELQAADRHETAKARIPAISGMVQFIGNTSTYSSADFSELPLTTRKRLIEGIKNAIGQAVQRLATDRQVNVLEFMATRKELKAASQLISDVLAAPLFNDDSTQASVDNARQDKDLAARGLERGADGKFVKVKH